MQQKACQILSFVKILALLIQARVLLINRIGYQSLQVSQFSFQKLIQNYKLLLGFCTKRTSAINRAWLGVMKPLYKLLIRYYLTISSSLVVILQSRLQLRVLSPSRTILWLYKQCGGSLSNSSFKNTLVKFQYSSSKTFLIASSQSLVSSLILNISTSCYSQRIWLILYKLVENTLFLLVYRLQCMPRVLIVVILTMCSFVCAFKG